jgi:aminoglycoside phosphotransferase (APT) family kinase protein
LRREHEVRVTSVLRRAERHGIASRTEVRRLAELLAQTSEALECAPDVPVLAHRDLQPQNVVCDRAGTIVGLVDFEAAGGGDPAEDFSRVGLDWTTPSFATFCQSYFAAAPDIGLEAPERVAFHVLYWAALLIGQGRIYPAYVPSARRALERAAAGERPVVDSRVVRPKDEDAIAA